MPQTKLVEIKDNIHKRTQFFTYILNEKKRLGFSYILVVVSRNMKRLGIIVIILCVLVYAISWFFGTPYIHILIGLLGIQLFMSLASTGGSEDEFVELKAEGSGAREWHVWILFTCLFSALVVAEYYFPILASYGQK